MKKNSKLFKKIFSIVLLISTTISSSVVYLPIVGSASQAEAASKTFTSRADYKTGYFNGTEADSKEGDLKLKADGTWNARVWRTPYVTLSDGTTFTSDGTNVYMLIGRDVRFVKYLPDEDRWQELASAPHMPYQGSDMTRVGNYIYVSFGGYQKEFSRYSIIDNTWTDMSDLPDLVNSGSSLGTDGTNIYAIRGAGTQDFWKYTVSTNTWSTLTSAPATISSGADLTYYSGYFYTPRGGGTTTMYRYDPTGNSWSTMTAAPGTLGDNGNVARKGSDIYVLRGSNTATFYKYSITDNSWSTLTNTPAANRYVGAVYSSYEDKLYVFRGNSTYDWWKYDTTADSFEGTTDLPTTSTTGGDLVFYNGNLYYRRGGNNAFYSLNVSNNTWTTLTAAPASFGSTDNKGATASGNLYFYQGAGTSFYRYNVSGGTWSTLATTPASVNNGGSLTYPGSGNYIYGTRGSGTTSFWRYDISGDSWSDAAVADLPSGAQMNIGSRLVSDSQNVYAITGIGTSQLYKYDIGEDTWTLIGSVPFASYYGTDVVYYNGKIYAQSGYYKTDLWEYTIATNTWRKMGSMPGYYAQDIGPYAGGSLAIDSSNSTLYSINGGLVRLLSFSLSSYNYPVSGTWHSDTIDLTYATSFTSLTADTTTPSDSSISFETRTSTDAANWSSWQSVSGTTIASTPRRYIQVKATLSASSDRTQTPTLSDTVITYTGDTTAPNNPTSVTGLATDGGGTSLTSGASYPYPHPYFTWTGGSDTESSIAGYYVYFGTSSSADPQALGNYQTSASYVVTSVLSTDTYYLRVKTKDVSGNISSATTLFTYLYNGVSPAQTNSYTSAGDFSNGTETNVITSGNEIKLASASGFWQQERLSNAPATFNYGASFAYVSSSNKLYTFRGGNTTTFYSYDIDSDTWSTLAAAPAAVYQGGDLIEGPSGYLYGTRGANTSSFWRYDIANDTWSDAAASDPPSALSYGSAIIFDGDHYIYAIRGNTDDAFYRYDTDTDTWDTLANTDFGAPTSQPNNNIYIGGDLAFDSTTQTVYAIQGNTNTGFASYNIGSDSWTQLTNLPAIPYDGAQIAYDSSTNAIFYISGWTNPFLYKYSISSGTWTKMADAPAPMSTGTSMRNVNGEFYVIRGASTNTLWKYSVSKNSWLVPTIGLFGTEFRGTDYRPFGYGAQIIKGDSNYYYILRGNYDNLMTRYDATTGEAVQMADIPYGLYSGSSITYNEDTNTIYVIPSQNTQRLLIYDVATDTWSEDSQDVPPAVPGTGSSMEYDGSQYIYWIRGGGTTTFYRYDTQASAGSRWSSALAAAPAALSYGAHLVYKDGYVYTLRGNNVASNPFYRYSVSGNSWTTLSSYPTAVYNDGFLVDGGGDYLYACRATNTATCYRYSILGNSWSTIEDAPANIYQGGSAASNKTDRMYVIAGAGGTNTYANGLYSYIMQTENSAFQTTGSYISPSIDYGSVYKYASINVTYTPATNASLAVYTRTSSDNSTWSSWAQADQEKIVGSVYTYDINSSPAKYIQVKFELSSGDGIYSGVISDYSLSYYQDSSAPTNPTTLSSYSTATQSATITSGNWYNYSSPSFSWPAAGADGGASDTSTGSGVLGYYVYFGTDSEADASVSGSLQNTTTYTAGNLSSGSTYYLKIKTKDDAGNVSPSNWSAFTYKFDNVEPSNPTTVTADPSGYTAVNSFNFSWSGATDSASGVYDYCYKTALNGSETCGVTVASASGVLAGSTGASTFYVRARDAAGNAPSTYSSVSYYYSATAPSAPQNLEVSPSSNTVNQFSFTWDPPAVYYGSQANLRYFYSVNALPTSQNVNQIGLTVTNLATDAYATLPGDNVMYVVAKDEAGNIDYNNYASVTFTADTSAPGTPKKVDIADISVKSLSAWKLAVSWESPDASGSGVASYKIYGSTVADASCTTNFSDFSYLASTTGRSYVDTDLEQTDYYYCVKACDSTNNCSAVSDTVTDLPTGKYEVAADLTASPSATVTTKTATITWSTSRTSNSFVKYGTSSGDYGTEVGSSTQVTSHEIDIENLAPGTTYYYVASWTDEDGNIGTSDEQTFTTDPAPSVSSVKVTNISINSALVTFTVEHASSISLLYGTTVNYGGIKTLSTSLSSSSYSIELDDLVEGTEYHLQIVSEDSDGNSFSGDDYTFETLPQPKITAAKIQQVAGQASATLRVAWTSNTPISSIVTYYPSSNPSAARDQVNLVLTKNHSIILSNLLDETDYSVVIKGKDSAGNEAVTSIQTVKTAADLRPPEIDNLNIESSIVGVGDQARAQVVVTWDSDEASSAQVEYAEGTGTTYSQSTQEDTNQTKNHTVTITGLMPARIYHLRAISKDEGGNTGYSFDTVIVTPKSTKDALSLVIENLANTFGFLKNLNNEN